jgi:hypothetical protein
MFYVAVDARFSNIYDLYRCKRDCFVVFASDYNVYILQNYNIV